MMWEILGATFGLWIFLWIIGSIDNKYYDSKGEYK